MANSYFLVTQYLGYDMIHLYKNIPGGLGNTFSRIKGPHNYWVTYGAINKHRYFSEDQVSISRVLKKPTMCNKTIHVWGQTKDKSQDPGIETTSFTKQQNTL